MVVWIRRVTREVDISYQAHDILEDVPMDLEDRLDVRMERAGCDERKGVIEDDS